MISNKAFALSIFAFVGLLLTLIAVRCLCKNGSIKEPMTEETLIFFYADWCGYCQQFKPEVEKYKGIPVQYVNCTSPSDTEKQLMREYDVSGFPAVFYRSSTSVITFNKQRTLEGIEEFVSECRRVK